MGFDTVSSTRAMDDPARYGGTAPKIKNNGKRRKSDAERDREHKLHGRLLSWLLQERDKQGPNRVEMATDEDFYDGLQWSDEDAAELMDRCQAPLVFNQVKPTINWLLGTERRTRIDGKVLPRCEDDEEGAEVKSKLLKYLSDVNRTPFKRSQAFKAQIVAGLGWMEDALETDPSQELLATRYVDWKEIYHDSNSKELDLSDARYLFRWKFVDLDVALAICPDKKDEISKAALDDAQMVVDDDNVWYLGAKVNSTESAYTSRTVRGIGGGYINGGREVVKLIECWYKVPVPCQVCRSDDPEAAHLNGEKWDPDNKEMADLHRAGFITVAGHTMMEVRAALMTESCLLYEAKSPYRHNRFPYTPLWCYRRHRDGLPYGVIRDIRDAQIDYNKRASKALYILSTVRVVMDEGAVEDVEELRQEVARPDPIITKKRGYELKIEQDKQLAEEHIKLMIFDGQMIRDVGGVTDQNLGNAEGAMSGKAIGKLQDQGTIVTAALFDNMRLAIQLQTEIQLSLLEQYYTAPKVVRLIGDNKPLEWLKINVYDETAGKFINDITRSKADYVVDEQDFKASTRQAMFESMMELVGKLDPQVGLALLDMVIDFADVPNKEEIVARIRKINGQADPSRKPTPEEEQARTEQQQKAAALDQINVATLQSALEKTQAETKALLARVDQSAAETQRIVADAVQKGVTAAYEALQAAQIVATVPGVTPVADAVLAGAGYKDQGGQDPNIPAPAIAQAPAQQVPQRLPALQQADGAQQGIETMPNDGMQHLAGGGRVTGPGTATSDSVPVMASDGEYVLNASAANVLGTKVLDAINEIARKGGDAYQMQREFRELHPLLDAALSFVPVVGTATAVDDIQHDLRNGQYGAAALDAVGLVPGGRIVKTGIKATHAAEGAVRRAVVAGSHSHLVHDAGDAVQAAAALGAGAGTGVYAADLMDRERAAAKKRDEKQ